MLIGL